MTHKPGQGTEGGNQLMFFFTSLCVCVSSKSPPHPKKKSIKHRICLGFSFRSLLNCLDVACSTYYCLVCLK